MCGVNMDNYHSQNMIWNVSMRKYLQGVHISLRSVARVHLRNWPVLVLRLWTTAGLRLSAAAATLPHRRRLVGLDAGPQHLR